MTAFAPDGREFEVWEGVYEPAEDTMMLLAEALVHSPSTTLEVGTGCGMIAVSVSKAGCPWVLATDLSARTVMCAKTNAARNAAHVRFLVGDLLLPFRGSFDMILFNPPYLPVDRGAQEELYWAGGREGREVIDHFLRQVGDRLSPGGLALLVQSSHNDLRKTEAIAAEEGLDFHILARQSFFFETIQVVGLWKSGRPRV